MTRNFLIHSITLSLFMTLSGCQREEIDWNTLDDSVIRLVAQTDKGTASGSAFAVNDQGYYVTNHHVVAPALSGGVLAAVEAVSPAKKMHPATVIWHSAEKDLAIVRVPDWRRPPVSLGDEAKVKKNQVVISIGFPGASDFNTNNPGFTEPKIKRGVISARQSFPFLPSSNPVQVFEHDATVNSGNSGGPLVDVCGRVVGVNVAKAQSQIGVDDLAQALEQGSIPVNIQEGTFFAIRVNELKSILKQEGIDFLGDATPCQATPGIPQQWYYLALAALVLVSVLYYRLRHSSSLEKVDSRYISRLIRKKLGSEDMQNQEKKLNGRKLIRGPDGQIINAGAKEQQSARETGGQAEHTGTILLSAEQTKWPDITLSSGDSITLGRDPNQVDVSLHHEDVSRQHARLRMTEQGELQVIDLSSSNGTYLDHARVSEQDWSTISSDQRLIISGEDIVYRLTAKED